MTGDRLSDYDYVLPEHLIAQSPLADRAASRLLWLHRSSGEITHQKFSEVPELLRAGDLLVLNDTRVSAIRLFGRRPSGGQVEALLLESKGGGQYVAMVKPGRRLKAGTTVQFPSLSDATLLEELVDGLRLLQFPDEPDLVHRLAEAGLTPLPPYIHERLADPERYQTVYGERPGSAAAPTAGLHFTPEILATLESKGIGIARVTLHVGIDTFRPVQVDDLTDHRMHGEECVVPFETVQQIRACSGRVIAVGTTTVRTLESFADEIRGDDAPRQLASRTSIFIKPGFRFRVVDGMFTNFHLPRTTMLMMISALVGREQVMAAYEEAIRENYRFLSFGDSMLLL